MDWLGEIGFLIIGLSIAWAIIDIRSRIKVIQNKQARLSITYFKVLGELHSLHEAMFLYNKQNPESVDIFKNTKRRKMLALKFRIEQGPEVSHLLSGLEFPDIDDDKAFWQGEKTLAERLGLVDRENEEFNDAK